MNDHLFKTVTLATHAVCALNLKLLIPLYDVLKLKGLILNYLYLLTMGWDAKVKLLTHLS